MSTWIHVTAGVGPAECQWAAARAAEARTERWLAHQALERGRAVRTYEGPDFRRR